MHPAVTITDVALALDRIARTLYELPAPNLSLDYRPPTAEQQEYKQFTRAATYAGWGPDQPASASEPELTDEQAYYVDELEAQLRRHRLAEAASMLVDRGCADPAVVFIADGTAWETALEMCGLLSAPTALAS